MFYCETCGGKFGCGSADDSLNPCCTANDTPYCSDAPCCESVCAVDPFCCDAEGGGVWDQDCADLAWQLCPDLPGCSPPPPPQCGDSDAGECCEANGTPFCKSGSCCNTVCQIDAYCCDVEWDECCADLADEHCGSLCSCGTGNGDCCCGSATPGCSNVSCCQAVCAVDPFCCDVAWDTECIAAARQIPLCSCDGSIPCEACLGFGEGDCCVANYTPGCDDPLCCQQVCACDPFCCFVGWDELCASAKENPCSAVNLCGCDPPNPADLTGDNIVGVPDLLFLLQNWG